MLTRIFALLLLISMASCVPRKRLTYLQDNGSPLELDSAKFQERLAQDYRIQVNDILSIQVRSLNQETATMFNLQENQQRPVGGQGADLIFYLQGYSVGVNGSVQLPVVGEVPVVGLRLSDAKRLIENKLGEYFTEGYVFAQVQLAGINYSVVGDIARPGKYVLYRNRAHIFEALANAGDITFVGDRRSVQIIRQMPDGYHVFELDLTDQSVLNDPNFFIQPNDVINVKPLAAKSWGVGTTGIQSISAILSVLTSTIVVLTFVLNN